MKKKILSKRLVKKWSKMLESGAIVLAVGSLSGVLPKSIQIPSEWAYLILGILAVVMGRKSAYKFLTGILPSRTC